MPITATNPFKGRHFPGTVILLCVRWYLRYPLAYEHVAELLAERGVEVDPRCIWRWVQTYAPELNKRCRPYLKPPTRATAPSRWSRGVTRWFRWGLSVSGPFVCRCLTSASCSVFTPRSSNRTGAFNASGSRRKAHDFAHGRLWVRVVRRTSPSTACKSASGYCLVAGLSSLCLAHSH